MIEEILKTGSVILSVWIVLVIRDIVKFLLCYK